MKFAPGSVASELIERFLNVYTRFGARGGLSGLLQRNATLIHAMGGEDCVVDVVLTPQVAVDGTVLTKGVLLAMLDEFSTMASVVEDKMRRPGVSIAMDVRFHPRLEKLVADGERVRFTTKMLKTGQNVSFCRMEALHLPTETVLASGTHIKFSPMPFPWEILMQPALQPYTIKLGSPLMSPSAEESEAHDLDAPIEDCFRLTYGDNAPSIEPINRMCNPMGAVHGGALGSVAIGAAEWAAKNASLSHVHLQFCSSAKPGAGTLISEVEEVAILGDDRREVKQFRGMVKQGERARLCVEFTATVTSES